MQCYRSCGYRAFPGRRAGHLLPGDPNTGPDTQHRVTGNGTLNFHISEDAILPPAMKTKQTLVE